MSAKMRAPGILLVLVAWLAFPVPPAYADVPRFVTWSGRLTDGTGWNQSAVLPLRVSLWDAATGGTGLWQQAFDTVAVEDGYFSALLGDGTVPGTGAPLNVTDVFRSHPATWITVAAGTGPDLEPRQPVGSVPYAASAQFLGGRDAAGFIFNQTGTPQAGGIHVDGTVKAAAFVGDGSGLTALPGGSGKYIQNQVAAVQAGAGFSIGGNALVGGRVGIGTTSPSHQLHLTGSMRIEDKQDIVFYNTGGEVYQGIIYADEAAKRFLVHTGDDRHLWFGSQGKGYNIRFNTNEGTWKERMVIQSGGNVGIGTATPSATLDVAGGARVSGTAGLASTILSGSGTAITASQEGGTGYNFIGKNAGANTFRVMNTGNLLLDVPAGSGGTPALSVNNAGAGPAAVFSGGNVGIGKSTPDALLDVYEGMKFGSGKPDYNVIVVAASSMGFPASDGTLDNWSSNGAYWAMPMVYRSRPGGAFPFDRYGELILQGTSHGTSYNRGISLATTPQATNVPAIRMRITEGGAVGIGTTSPSAKLDLDGASGDALLRLRVSKTPTSSADPSGNVGSFAWDDNYVYMKTNKGWRRAALGAF